MESINQYEKWMRKALDLAKEALSHGEFPVGCILVSRGKVVGTGARICSVQEDRNELDHAEILALRDWLSKGQVAEGLTAYITLEPCLMCYGALVLNGVKRIVYAYEDVMGGATGLVLNEPTTGMVREKMLYDEIKEGFLYRKDGIQIVSGILRQESLSLFKKFFQDPRNSYWQESILSKYTLMVK